MLAKICLVVLLAVAFTEAFDFAKYKKFRNKRAFECKELNAECKGLPKCCGTAQCYWPDGYSVFKPGKCVECVQPNQKCQRDSQCCSGLMCHKQQALHMDGVCSQTLVSGHNCYRDKQCSSGQCDKEKFWHVNGKCQ